MFAGRTDLSVSVEGGEFVLVDVAVDVPDGGPGRRAERTVDVPHQSVDRLFQVLKENVVFRAGLVEE